MATCGSGVTRRREPDAGQTATLPDGTLGYEWDEDMANDSRPPGLVRLSTTDRVGVEVLSTKAAGTSTGRRPTTSPSTATAAARLSSAPARSSGRGARRRTHHAARCRSARNAAGDGQPLRGHERPARSLQSGLAPAAASTDTTPPTVGSPQVPSAPASCDRQRYRDRYGRRTGRRRGGLDGQRRHLAPRRRPRGLDATPGRRPSPAVPSPCSRGPRTTAGTCRRARPGGGGGGGRRRWWRHRWRRHRRRRHRRRRRLQPRGGRRRCRRRARRRSRRGQARYRIDGRHARAARPREALPRPRIGFRPDQAACRVPREREARCTVRLRIFRRGDLAGQRKAVLPGGRSRTVTVKLNRATRRKLAASRSLQLTAVAVATDAAGNGATTGTSIRLLPPRS